MTAFPFSKGTLKDKRPRRVLEEQEMKKLNKGDYDNIFALPIQLKSIMESDLTVEVVQVKENAVLLRHLKPKRKRKEVIRPWRMRKTTSRESGRSSPFSKMCRTRCGENVSHLFQSHTS